MNQEHFEVREFRPEMVNIPNSICQDWFTRWLHRFDEPFPTWDLRRFRWLETDLERNIRLSPKDPFRPEGVFLQTTQQP